MVQTLWSTNTIWPGPCPCKDNDWLMSDGPMMFVVLTCLKDWKLLKDPASQCPSMKVHKAVLLLGLFLFTGKPTDIYSQHLTYSAISASYKWTKNEMKWVKLIAFIYLYFINMIVLPSGFLRGQAQSTGKKIQSSANVQQMSSFNSCFYTKNSVDQVSDIYILEIV